MPIRPNALWALDFQFDSTIDGRQVKMLNVIDEYTRECRAIVVDHSIDADQVVGTLARLSIERGRPPAFVRFNNGPELVSHAVADWCKDASVDSVFIDPGSPWQNAWIGSFNGRFRDELLNLWHFDSMLEAQVIIEDHRIDYNNQGPHSALNQQTPANFDANWDTNNQSPRSRVHATWTRQWVPLSVTAGAGCAIGAGASFLGAASSAARAYDNCRDSISSFGCSEAVLSTALNVAGAGAASAGAQAARNTAFSGVRGASPQLAQINTMREQISGSSDLLISTRSTCSPDPPDPIGPPR